MRKVLDDKYLIIRDTEDGGSVVLCNAEELLEILNDEGCGYSRAKFKDEKQLLEKFGYWESNDVVILKVSEVVIPDIVATKYELGFFRG